jgi:hypothetical protein
VVQAEAILTLGRCGNGQSFAHFDQSSAIVSNTYRNRFAVAAHKVTRATATLPIGPAPHCATGVSGASVASIVPKRAG